MLNIRKLSILITLIWMVFIYGLSAQPAKESNQLSKSVTEHVVETVEKVAQKTEINPDRFNHIVRKNAHFFLYLMLAFFVLFTIRQMGVRGAKAIILTMGICFLYAVTDEVHQLFVPGRGGQVKDVVINSLGAIVGIGLYGMFSKLFRRNKVSE